MFESLGNFKRHAHHAVITIGNAQGPDELSAALETAYGERLVECRFATGDAPGDRGTELHVTSADINKDALKEGLRKAKALLEAGELPTGARA